MSNTSTEINYIVKNDIIEYYTYGIPGSPSSTAFAGKLSPGVILSVVYESGKKAYRITKCSTSSAIGKYILGETNKNGVIVLFSTDITTDESNYIVKDDYIEYYMFGIPGNSSASALVGRLAPGAILSVEYDINKNAYRITKCSNPSAIGKYILSKTNKNGVLVLFENDLPNTSQITNDEYVNMYYSDDISLYTSTYLNAEDYSNNLKEGLRINDLRGILGMPHQFLPNTDPRIDGLEAGTGYHYGIGRIYAEKIVKNIPLLLMTPGNPQFLSGYSDEQRNKIIGKIIGFTEETFDTIFGRSKSGKYYSLKFAYTEYFNYVNAMLRSAAFYLGIQDRKIDGESLGSFNWLYGPNTASLNDRDLFGLIDIDNNNIFSNNNLVRFLGPYNGCVAFYADAGDSVDDSFSNSTRQSTLVDGGIKQLSDSAKELNFVLGNVGGMAGYNLDILREGGMLQNKIDSLTDKISEIVGGNNNIISSILGNGSTILGGGNILFPEIWDDSSFSRSYSCSMKLVSPSGDKLSVFLNILVPIYHLLGFVLPRQGFNQSYYSPFLVRAFHRGLFNVDMGIITNLSITKGDEGEWTKDGIPTVANISFEIRDLYDGLFMTPQKWGLDDGILSNIQELDYIANSCGINVNDQEIARTAQMAAVLGFTSNVTDAITIGIFGEIIQSINQKVQNIFGKF